MEENVQQLLKDKNEDVVQFNFENNTSSPVAIDLFDTASLLTIPTSGNPQTTYTPSNDLLPTLPPSLFALNPNNGTFVASGIVSPSLTLINTTTNTTENNFDNNIGFNGGVRSIAIQPDGKILCGGDFTTYKGLTENYIIRLNSNGSKDLSFDNNIGFNGLVFSIVLQPDGKILCGGGFTTYKGITDNNCIIRLNADGSIDSTFDNSIGFNGGVRSIAIQPDGKIICGGAFIDYKGVSANRIIRLNADGTKDTSFDNSIGFFLQVLTIAIQPDGRILCGGTFTTYKGVSANRIIRLNPNGLKDTTFDNNIGFDSAVLSIAIQPDGKILVGGSFTTYKGLTENRIIRLNLDGSIDSTFDNNIGFDFSVNAITIQSDGKILVGGLFTSYKSVTNDRIIRLNADGTKDLTFDNSIGFDTNVNAITIQSDGKILVGGAFSTYKGYVNNSIVNLQSNGFSASTLNLFNPFLVIQYNSITDTFYANDGSDIYTLSSDGQSITPSLPLQGNYLSINTNNNYAYFLDANVVNVVDCSTNTLLTTIILPNLSQGLSNVTSSNCIYFIDEVTGLMQKIDCNTNTLVLVNIVLPSITIPPVIGTIFYNSINDLIYVTDDNTNIISVVNTLDDTYFTSITLNIGVAPYLIDLNPLNNQIFISDISGIGAKQYSVIDCTTNTLISTNTLSGIGDTYGVIYNPLTDSMYISGSLFSVVTFTATPFFIGGSTNYNTFVNNLNFEPIFIDEIRILTQNLTQLTNQVQFTKIDSNGNQIFFPEFPINKIDVDQNNNIAGLQLNGLVFDGRTYINQYVINPNQIVSFEIYYKQLNRFSASPTLPIFFKDKIQLKDYIKKDYNNYDVEM